MSSSTSSSSRLSRGLRRELLVVTVALSVLATSELLFRVVAPRVSADLAALQAIPARAAKLAAAPGMSILVLGNSLAIRGFRQETFLADLRRKGVDATCETIALPAAEMCEYSRILEHEFIQPGYAPDLVLVLTGPAIWDAQRIHVERLAAVCGLRNAPQIMREEPFTFEQRACYLHACLSPSFAHAGRLRQALLSRLLPEYGRATDWYRETLMSLRERGSPQRTYERLRRLGQLAAASRLEVVVVLMPFADRYELPPPAAAALRGSGLRVLDCRDVPGLEAADYTDGVHMNEAGAALFTPALARRLAPALALTAPGHVLP
jgi:hypothetical protein